MRGKERGAGLDAIESIAQGWRGVTSPHPCFRGAVLEFLEEMGLLRGGTAPISPR